MKQSILSFVRKTGPSILILIACAVICVCVWHFTGNMESTREIDLSEYSAVNKINNFSTLRSYYHNVAVYREEPDDGTKLFNTIMLWPFDQILNLQPGYKQVWLEYVGTVETGIKDTRKINISDPDANGEVRVYIPDAEVIDTNAEQFSEPLTEQGLFTEISGENQAEAYREAQSSMRQEAENDTVQLNRAKENARILIENYIVNTGKTLGVEYKVIWVNDPF